MECKYFKFYGQSWPVTSAKFLSHTTMSQETDERDEASSARKHRRSSEVAELQLEPQSSSSTASIDQELSCGRLGLPHT